MHRTTSQRVGTLTVCGAALIASLASGPIYQAGRVKGTIAL